jgi:hypothetical protein
MNEIEAAARHLARARGTAVGIADTYDIEHDPDEIFAIVPMRVVGEEIIQAVGYGALAYSPAIVLEHHALSRRTHFLRPLAKALNDYLKRMIARSRCPRIYVAHPSALEVLAVMAARYENAGRNPNPNPMLRPKPLVVRLGYLCRVLKDIYHMPGQQVVIVMTEAMTRHFVTGQIPPKDGHLGALTEWIAAPLNSAGTQDRADAAALAFPAAAMLSRRADDEVEAKLQHMKKVPPAQRAVIKSRIEYLQRDAVQTEWAMLQRAHTAFWGRELGASSFPTITEENISWLSMRFKVPVRRARRAIAMSQRYELDEYLSGIHKTGLILSDRMRFERERAKGKAFVGAIVAVRKHRSNNQIDIDITAQAKIQLRPGHRVQLMGRSVIGEVRAFSATPTGHRATLSVIQGIRSVTTGGPHQWSDPVPEKRFSGKYYSAIKTALGIP